MIDNFRLLYKTKYSTTTPLISKGNIQIVKNFFKDYFIAVVVLVKISANGVIIVKPFRKRFPQKRLIFMLNLKNRLTTGDIRKLGNFIIGIIWEKCKFSIFSSCSQSSITGYKKPVIGIANDTHEKGTHLIVVGNFIIFFTL